MRPGSTWLVWCGRGRPSPDVAPGARRRGVVEGSGSRSFAVFDTDRPVDHDQLQVAVRDHLAVAFAGWLVNRPDVERRLPRPCPPPEGDAELVLERYRLGGAPSLTELRGSFAVVVWDGDSDTLVATRDPIGTFPLFWAEAGSALVLSSATDTLLGPSLVPPALNRATVASHLRKQWPDVGETYVQGARRLPPGHTLRSTGKQNVLSRTWDPWQAGSMWSAPGDVDEFEERFEQAVHRCLDRGPIGMFLSGGLDSASIAALAADQTVAAGMPAPLALSLHFSDPGTDEHQTQQSLARQLGFPMVMVDLEKAVAPTPLFEAALQLAADWPTPLTHLWQPSYLMLGETARQQGCRAIVTGQGGDEWLTVDPILGADLLTRLDLRGLSRLALAVKRSSGASSWEVASRGLWRYCARPVLGRAARQVVASVAPSQLEVRDRSILARSTPGWLAPDPSLRQEIDERFAPPSPPSSFYERNFRTGLDHALTASGHEDNHEAGRRTGAPILSPFWDPDLVELVARLPQDDLNRGGWSKGLVRTTLDRRFPTLSYGKQVKSTATPTFERIIVAEAGHLWRRLGGASHLAELGIVEPARLDEMVEATLATRDRANLWRVHHVLAMELFTRRLHSDHPSSG